MRDQKLEKLSSATALGFWAENVILGLDRITRLKHESEEDRKLLTDAASILDDAIGRSEHPFAALGSRKGVAATDAALDVAERLVEGGDPEKTQEMLRDVALILRKVAEGEIEGVDLAPAFNFFAEVGKHQLAVGNSLSGYSGGTESWMVGQVISSFS